MYFLFSLTSPYVSKRYGTKTTFSTINHNAQVVFGKLITKIIYLQAFNFNYFSAITHGRGHASSEIGIALINVNSPKLQLIQLSDDVWYNNILTKINIYTPVEILLPAQITSNSDLSLIKKIRTIFPKITITEVSRKYFNDKDGLELIRNICADKYKNVIDVVTKKYYCLSAASALLQCITHYGIQIADRSIQVQFETKEGSLMIGNLIL